MDKICCRKYFLWLVFACLNLLHQTTSAEDYPPIHHNWTRIERMDPNGIFILQWHLRNNEIVFKATVNSRGFIAIGFLYQNPRFNAYDIALSWVSDRSGKANILDCHGKNTRFEGIVRDDTQNYVLEDEGYQNLTHTIVTFRRPIKTCDPRDVSLNDETLKIFWGHGERDIIPTQLDKIKFKAKGIRPIHLLSPSFKKPNNQDEQVNKWDVTVNEIKISEDIDTLYWCKIFKAPDLESKNHIIGFEPILTRDSTTKKSVVHHMTLFECKFSSNIDQKAFEKNTDDLDKWTKSSGDTCNSNIFSANNWDSCITPVALYSFGGSSQFLPEHVGIPFYGRQKYYMLEIHYDNPIKKSHVDSSGFRLHYTNKLRKHDAGIMINGVTTSNTQLIPPKQKLFKNIGICGPTCTGNENVFPKDGINIISVSVHTHIAGRKINLTHVREGKELNRIVEDNYYNHNYQETRQLSNETKVLPGDYLIIECSYETLGRKIPTLGGYSTKEEMCLGFITYYPKIDLVGCYSMIPVKEFFEYFGVYQFYKVNITDVENMVLYGQETPFTPSLPSSSDIIIPNEIRDTIDEFDEYYKNSILNKLIISDPIEFHDRTFLAHLSQLPWDDITFSQQLENVLINGRYMLFCRVSNKSIHAPTEITKYPQYTRLENDIDNSCPYHSYFELLSDSTACSLNYLKLLQLFIVSSIILVFTN